MQLVYQIGGLYRRTSRDATLSDFRFVGSYADIETQGLGSMVSAPVYHTIVIPAQNKVDLMSVQPTPLVFLMRRCRNSIGQQGAIGNLICSQRKSPRLIINRAHNCTSSRKCHCCTKHKCSKFRRQLTFHTRASNPLHISHCRGRTPNRCNRFRRPGQRSRCRARTCRRR